MAFGNVIGSNIFNILFILGVTAAISPVAFIMENVVDSILLVLVSILVWVFAWSRLHIEKKKVWCCLHYMQHIWCISV